MRFSIGVKGGPYLSNLPRYRGIFYSAKYPKKNNQTFSPVKYKIFQGI